MSLLDALYLPAIASGVATAIRHAVSVKTMTRQYPEVEPVIPPNYRGVHRLNRDAACAGPWLRPQLRTREVSAPRPMR
jgi:NADH-quinone oxidoreductase subunit I